jgi:hypothetical protein
MITYECGQDLVLIQNYLRDLLSQRLILTFLNKYS